MKKKLKIVALYVGGALLTGAVAVSTVDKLLIEPLTVETPGGLFERYIQFRERMGPIVPPGVMYQDVADRMAEGDWSFLNENWFFTFRDGVLYVPEKSALAKGLSLPALIQAREDLETGEIYIFSAPLTNGNPGAFSGLAAFSAPDFMTYEGDIPLDQFLFDELAPRRVVWEVTLKPEEDAWIDLMFQRNEAAAAKLLEDGEMMAMRSVPEEHTNDLWLAMEPQTNGYINLNVFAPEDFTNRVEVYSCGDLVSNVWNIAWQNLYPSGTNPVTRDAGGYDVRFFAAGNMDIDSDSDGVPDARELYIYKTDPEVSNLSPAIGNGTDLGSIDAIDIDNNRRAGAWTIGAYQVNDSTSSVDTLAPVVYFVEPFEGTVVSHGALTVSAAAKDNVDVAGVQFKLNGSSLGNEVTTPPFSNVWNTASATNGLYELTAVARDAEGNTATSAVVSVIVNTNATDYYVSSVNTNRSDSNSGTDPDAPWETFGKVTNVWNNLNPGDTIHLERDSSWDISLSSNWKLQKGGNSEEGSITLRGDDYGNGEMPVVRRTGGNGSLHMVDIQRSYVIVRDFEIDGQDSACGGVVITTDGQSINHINVLNMTICNGGGGTASGSTGNYICGIWVQPTNTFTAASILIQGNNVSGYNAHGINIYGTGYISNCIVRDNIVTNENTSGRFTDINAAIQIGGPLGSGIVIENNYFSDQTLAGETPYNRFGQICMFPKTANMTGNVLVRHNIIAASPHYGILVTSDDQGVGDTLHTQISGNVIYGSQLAGIAITPDNTYGSGSTIDIYNNTLFDNCQSGVHFPSDNNKMGEISIHHSLANTAIQIINNLIYHVPHSDSICLNYSIYETPGGTFTHNHNFYYDSAGAFAELVEALTDTYASTNITSFESTAQAGDPLLMNTNQLPTETNLSGGTSPDGLVVQPWP